MTITNAKKFAVCENDSSKRTARAFFRGRNRRDLFVSNGNAAARFLLLAEKLLRIDKKNRRVHFCQSRHVFRDRVTTSLCVGPRLSRADALVGVGPHTYIIIIFLSSSPIYCTHYDEHMSNLHVLISARYRNKLFLFSSRL